MTAESGFGRCARAEGPDSCAGACGFAVDSWLGDAESFLPA
jgi:hypothetical protein